jgi:hypothetical protein
LVVFRLNKVEVVATRLFIVAVPVAVMFVPVALPKIRFVKYPVTEFKTFVKILSPVVIPVNLKLERELIVVVATSPAISDVKRFVEEENVKELLLTVVVPVEEDDTPEMLVVATTPFTFEVKIPFVKSIAFVVATVIEAFVSKIPLIVVVPLRTALFTFILPEFIDTLLKFALLKLELFTVAFSMREPLRYPMVEIP